MRGVCNRREVFVLDDFVSVQRQAFRDFVSIGTRDGSALIHLRYMRVWDRGVCRRYKREGLANIPLLVVFVSYDTEKPCSDDGSARYD